MKKRTAEKLDSTKTEVLTAAEKTEALAEEALVVQEAVPAAEESVKEETAPTEKPVKRRGRKPGTKNGQGRTKKLREEVRPEVFIQYQGNEGIVAEAIEKAKAAFVADGHRISTIKTLQVYLKPEEYAAYYVINKKFTGRVDLF